MVADLTHGGRHLEVALVDVSGKGREAGTRSLLLSGALGALLGSLPPVAFLDEANRYLVRQSWDEGFATAVHVDINLDTGEFSVGNAGHPAPVRYSRRHRQLGHPRGRSGAGARDHAGRDVRPRPAAPSPRATR